MSRSIATSACRLATSRKIEATASVRPLELVAQQAVLAGDVAVDRQLVPFLGVADIVDRDVVVLAPEERHGVELLAQAQHVERRGLALALGDHPVLDADRLAAVRIGPAGDVAGGEDARRAGLEKRVDHDAAIDGEPRLLGKLEPRPHADAHDDEIGLERAAALQLHLLAVDGGHRVLEMEDDAVLLVQRAHEVAHRGPQDALHRPLLRRHDMDLDLARAQRGRRPRGR